MVRAVNKMFILWLMFTVKLVITQDNVVENICRNCGDAVNDYCCRFYGACCEYINPSGCPTPASPEARVNCRRPLLCQSNKDCPIVKQCCFTSLCGAVCMKPTMFEGYNY